MSSVLIIDNYDSFVYNLARYTQELGWDPHVRRNDQLSLDQISALNPSHIIISPGPCTPHEAGISNQVIQEFGPQIPILGVCLGHQCIGQVFGGKVEKALKPMHGKLSFVTHTGKGIFEGLQSPLQVTRYHSLIVLKDTLPDDLEITSESEEGEIMALRHRSFPIHGVQFHPEAVLTQGGYELIHNFLRLNK